MKLMLTIRKLYKLLPPQTWLQVYAAILTLLLIFLAAALIIDMLKGALP